MVWNSLPEELKDASDSFRQFLNTMLFNIYYTIQYNRWFALKNWEPSCQPKLVHKLKKKKIKITENRKKTEMKKKL